MIDRPGDKRRRDALDDVVDAVWPEGPAAEWSSAAAWLSTEQRADVARRLDAMVRLTDPDVPDRIDARRAAELTGLSIPRIYSMAAAWRKRQSVESLGMNVANKAPRPPRIHKRVVSETSAMIDTVLATDHSMSASEVEQALVAQGVTMSSPTIRRLIKDGRRRMAPRAFGSRIILDSAGMDAMLDEQRMRLFAVVDAGTGLALGWIDGTERSQSLGLAFAADDAIGRIPSLDLEGFAVNDGEPEIELRLHEHDVEGRQILEGLLTGCGADYRIGTRHLGGAVIDALGDRLDRVWLGHGARSDRKSHRNGRSGHMPGYSGDLSAAVGAAIERHNLDRQRAADHPDVAVERVEAVKRKVMDRLRVVADAYDVLQAAPYYADVLAASSSPPD